jgi:hypothetical protein
MKITTDDINRSWWNTRISFEHVQSYATAAVNLYEALVALEDEGYQTAVFPSRGTTPFQNLTWNVHRSDCVQQRGPAPLLHSLNEPFAYGTVTLPFTADAPGDAVDGTSQIRDYWVRVLRAIINGDSGSSELRYYQYCVAELFGFDRTHGLPLRRAGKRFVFVDTVISGQAVCEIVSAFKRQGLEDFYLVLLVDEKGKKLKQQYRQVLEDLVRQGKAKLILVDALFTEDEGPAFTSTWCLSSPQLVQAAHRVMGGSGQADLVGTAISFVRVQADDTLGNVTSTRLGASLGTLLSTAVGEHLAHRDIRKFYTRALETTRKVLIATAIDSKKHGFDPLSTAETERIARSAIKAGVSIGLNRKALGLAVTSVDVSSSHVVRLHFEEKAVDDFLRNYMNDSTPALLSMHEP